MVRFDSKLIKWLTPSLERHVEKKKNIAKPMLCHSLLSLLASQFVVLFLSFTKLEIFKSLEAHEKVLASIFPSRAVVCLAIDLSSIYILQKSLVWLSLVWTYSV